MKLMFLIISLLFINVSVNAASTSLISLSAEAQPGKTGYIGVDSDSKNQLKEIYYKNSDGNVKTYTLQDLSRSQVLYSKKGYDLITIKVSSYTATSAILRLNFIKSVVDDETGSRYFIIKFNPHMNMYEMLDENQRQITHAYVVTHRNMIGVATGIEEIRTQ